MPRYHPLNPGIFVGPTGFVALPLFGSSKKKKPTPKMSFTPETTGEEVVKAYPDKVIGKTCKLPQPTYSLFIYVFRSV
jgi:hypothetical protein